MSESRTAYHVLGLIGLPFRMEAVCRLTSKGDVVRRTEITVEKETLVLPYPPYHAVLAVKDERGARSPPRAVIDP